MIRDVLGAAMLLGNCATAVPLGLVDWPETGMIKPLTGETDEKYVWFGGWKSVGFRSGDISCSDDIRMRRSDRGRLQVESAKNG